MAGLSVYERMEQRFACRVRDGGVGIDMPTVLADADVVVELCSFLKHDPALRFDFLSDMCGVDHHPERPRFEVVYHLYSIPFNSRLRIKCRFDEPPHVPSVTGVWSTANFHEREAFDMYGIMFDGHPDLRRIYMWDEFEGYPLRKDFPLRGYKDAYNPFGEEKD
ncbi:MAG: NADH-quinone oxidoreductase subunit C [Sphingomonadales bacterium]